MNKNQCCPPNQPVIYSEEDTQNKMYFIFSVERKTGETKMNFEWAEGHCKSPGGVEI